MKLFAELSYRWLLWQWKRRERKRRKANASIGNLPAAFRQLANANIPYAILRWYDELPLDGPDVERTFSGDLDILVASEALEDFCRVVSQCRGPLKIDLFSTGIRLGSDYRRMPYYPPVLGEELLRHCMTASAGYRRPDPRYALLSFVYHAVYHKGAASGLPSGLEHWQNSETAKHDYAQEMRRLAAEANLSLPDNLTLLSLHQWLQTQQWAMPYDLIPRWPVRNRWHDELMHHEETLKRQQLGSLHDLLVFLVREDAVKANAEETIRQRLSEKFTILDVVRLTDEQQQRVIRHTRGGDWTRHKSVQMVLPVTAIICHDPHPQPVDQNSKLAAVHTNVTNQNVFYKHELRAYLADLYPNAINFMHGSDNDLESLVYIQAIYGNDWQNHTSAWHL